MSIGIEAPAGFRFRARHALTEGLRRVAERFTKRRVRHELRDAMRSMSDSQLNDIGLTRVVENGGTRLDVSGALNDPERVKAARQLIQSMGWRSIR